MQEKFINNIYLKKLHNSAKKLIAFTLAELLVALTIIGILAALVIPGLLQQVQDSQNREALKKFISDFSQATLILQSRGVMDWSNGADLTGQYRTVMPIVKEGQVKNIFNKFYLHYKTTQGSGDDFWSLWGNNWDAFMLSNGMFVWVLNYNTNCSSNYTPVLNVCGEVRVDVNGSKGPNMEGKDLFHRILVARINGGYRVIPLPDDPTWGQCVPDYNFDDYGSRACASYVIQNKPMP